MHNFNLNAFVQAYMVCALWSSTDTDADGNTSQLDDEHGTSDIAPECVAAMRATCEDFCKANHADLSQYCALMRDKEWSGEARAGHDFWLSRNGHGTGFWDRGLGELGRRLDKAAEVYSSVDLYIGDDGLIYGETK